MIIYKSFVTNKHVLMQFDKKYVPKEISVELKLSQEGIRKVDRNETVIFERGGMIVTQDDEV